MNINILNTDTTPIYEQIKNRIKTDILKGELKENEALPSIRVLAKTLKISVITTKRAYDDLEKDGYIVSRVGKGSFVAQQSKDFIEEKRKMVIEEDLQALIKKCHIYSVSKQELIDSINEMF